MRRGRLRVLLGAAPGVGKTYTMLEEGRRLLSEGHDVVVAFVETHGRAATAAMVERPRGRAAPHGRAPRRGPRRDGPRRGARPRARDRPRRRARPHERARLPQREALAGRRTSCSTPASTSSRRSTPSTSSRSATSCCRSPASPSARRSPTRCCAPPTRSRSSTSPRRPSATGSRGGLVYPAERIDAALSNYFRLGNLTALRELALLWLADEVDSALKAYRAEHGIDRKWEARERVVVALTGGPEGETLLRRGARIASRSSGGELIAVHVTNPDGMRARHPGTLDQQRTLVEQLGGTFHQVVGEDVPRALVEFARSVDATQLVIGVSRRSRLDRRVHRPRHRRDGDPRVGRHRRAHRHARRSRLGLLAPEARRRAQPHAARRGVRRRARRRSAAQLAARRRSTPRPRSRATCSRTSCSSSSSRSSAASGRACSRPCCRGSR